MAASSGDDIPAQLAALLGREMVQIRKTADDPPRVSVIDVVQALSGMTKSNAGHYVDRLKEAHPEVCADCTNYRFAVNRLAIFELAVCSLGRIGTPRAFCCIIFCTTVHGHGHVSFFFRPTVCIFRFGCTILLDWLDMRSK